MVRLGTYCHLTYCGGITNVIFAAFRFCSVLLTMSQGESQRFERQGPLPCLSNLWDLKLMSATAIIMDRHVAYHRAQYLSALSLNIVKKFKPILIFFQKGGENGDGDRRDSVALSLAARQSQWKRIMLLVVAITVHNIPEGLAVGVSFGAAASSSKASFQSARLVKPLQVNKSHPSFFLLLFWTAKNRH